MELFIIVIFVALIGLLISALAGSSSDTESELRKAENEFIRLKRKAEDEERNRKYRAAQEKRQERDRRSAE